MIQTVQNMVSHSTGGGGVLAYMSNIGMCRYEGYGFQRVSSRIGYRNQSFGLE